MNLFHAFSKVVYLWKIQDLSLLIIGEGPLPELLQALRGGHGDLELLL